MNADAIIAATDVNIAATAALLADRTRARLLLALVDGRALSAADLAGHAGVTPATARLQLSRLVAGGLLAVEKQEAHSCYRLVNPDVGQALQTLAAVTPPPPVRQRESQDGTALGFARTCYDHLAGRLGVGLTQALLAEGTLAPVNAAFWVTAPGRKRLTEFGLDIATLQRQHRNFAPCCHAEHRQHVAGALGAALAEQLFNLGWVERLPSSRALQVTDAGRIGLARTFRLTLRP